MDFGRDYTKQAEIFIFILVTEEQLVLKVKYK